MMPGSALCNVRILHMLRILSIVLLQMTIFLLLFSQPCMAAACSTSRTGLSLYLEYSPRTIVSGEPFIIYSQVVNNYNTTKHIQLYSYVFRGSKSYSGNRTSNLAEADIPAGESISFELKNTADAQPGSYKLRLMLEDGNKTKYLSVPINITSPFEGNLEIAYLGLDKKDKSRAIALINNSRDAGYEIRLLFESPTSYSEREMYIWPHQEKEIEFSLSSPQETSYLFLKLYQNSTLIDVSELIIRNITYAKKAEKPFSLVDGDIILNSSREAYISSSVKSSNLAVYLLLLVSVVLNIALLARNKT